MILEILKYPDPRLREKSEPVTEFGPSIKKLAQDMMETMYAESGIGLAAAQVGQLLNMLVIDCRPKENGRYAIEEMSELEQKVVQPLVIINPKIVGHRGKTTFDEGCLSVPSYFETVERHDYIELEYQDENGTKKLLKTDGLLAIVIQHEMDHLEGTLFIDRISFVKSNKIKNQIKKTGYPEKKAREEEFTEVAKSEHKSLGKASQKGSRE
ncbi:MAG: peptide deformylase [Bdellovibrio sp.]